MDEQHDHHGIKPQQIYFPVGPLVVVLAPAEGACAGLSGTTTSTKSSWETAEIVNESVKTVLDPFCLTQSMVTHKLPW